jgi:hypothetical protein
MLRYLLLALSPAILLTLMAANQALAVEQLADSPAFDLTARRTVGDLADVRAILEVGGELFVPGDSGVQKALPLSVHAKLAYFEQLITWPADPADPARSLRRYSQAQATIKTDAQAVERKVREPQRLIVAELSDRGLAMSGLDAPLTRDEFDLINAVGNTLVVDRLLPGRSLREGEGWDHDAASIGALLGMDHVAVCEVRSVVTGVDKGQVEIRMAGAVHGTVDGAASEFDVRGAYLFHLERGRITKLNLAIRETRKIGEVTPGLDVTAKLSLVAKPTAESEPAPFDDETVERGAAMSPSALRQLIVEAPARGFRFRCDSCWFVTAERREFMSLRLLDGGEFLAHCNIAAAPPRPAAKPTTLQEFERDVCQALGDKVDKVEAASEWETSAGHRCLGVLVTGTVNEMEMQWRYYHLEAPGMPQATISVTVEKLLLPTFADADRPLVDSLELVALPAKTAAEPAIAPK